MDIIPPVFNMVPSKKNADTPILITSGIHALGLTVGLLAWWFYKADFSIPVGSVPLIGVATKENIFVAARVNLFYKAAITGSILWLGLTGLLQHLFNTRIKSFKSYSKGLYYTIPILPIAFFHLTGIDVGPTLLLLTGIFLIYLMQIIADHSPRLSGSGSKIQPNFELKLGLSFLLFILIRFLFGNIGLIQKSGTGIILIILLSILLITSILRGYSTRKSMDILLIIAAGIPFLVFLSIEWQILSLEKHWTVFGYKKIFVTLGFIWFLASIWITKKIRKHLIAFRKNIFVASLIFGYTLLVFYLPFIPVAEDLFEPANPANSILRVFQFHEIPMLDFMSSHMFSEQWYGHIYQLIFGNSGQTDFTIYSFLNYYFYFLIIYCILRRIGFNAAGSTLFIFTFPIPHDLFYFPICFVFLILFHLLKTSRNSTPKNFFLLFALLFILVIWRLDTGVAAIFSTMIFAPLYWWSARSGFRLSSLIKGLGLFLSSAVVVLITALLLRPWSTISGNFLSAFHYISGSQAHGYSRLFDGSYHQFYIFHVLFVIVSLVLTIAAVYLIRRAGASGEAGRDKWLVFSIFSFIVFLANAQRGLVRHGFAEHGEIFYYSTFYLGLAFFVGHFMQKRQVHLQYSLFFSLLFFSFIGTRYHPFFPDKLNLSHMLKGGIFETLNLDLRKENYQGRVRESEDFKQRIFGELKSYMDRNLKSDESFLDFSNTPMLYFYCQRPIPGYFNQNLQNSIDEYLQLRLIESLNKTKAPLVVYSSYPPGWFDATDGIANTLRYYRIAEYIYEHYRPLGILNNHSIWGIKERQWEEIFRKDTLVGKPTQLEMGYLAGWEGNRYGLGEGMKNFTILKDKVLSSSDTGSLKKMVIQEDITQGDRICLLLKVRKGERMYSDENQSRIIFRDTSENEVHRVSFAREDELFQYYAIRLSNHNFWHRFQTLSVEVENFSGFEKLMIIKEQ